MKSDTPCWEHFDCGETGCPVYGNRNLRCWLVPETRCRRKIQGKFISKIELCLACETLRSGMDPPAMEATLGMIAEQLKTVRELIDLRDPEGGEIGMEIVLGLSDVFDALKRISAGDPGVRIAESSPIELIAELKRMVNSTAENLGEIVDLSHEFAIGLAEHFDVLHRVAAGDLAARVRGTSTVELLDSLKNITNQMIDSVAREITERKQAETDLRESEERFRAFAEKAPIGITIMNPDRRFEYINPTFTEIFGFTRADIPDKAAWFEKAYPDEAYRKQVVSQWERDTIDKRMVGVPKLATLTVRAKDGRDKIISFRTVVQKDGRHFVTYADVTDRAGAEAAIKQSEEKYRTLIENIKDGVFIIQDERFQLVNRAFSLITGYSAGEIVGKRFQQLVHPDDRSMVEDRYRRRQAGEEIEREYEIRMLHRDGRTTLTVIMAVGIIDYFGSTASLGSITDITEKKDLEARLQRSQKMEALGTLAGGVAHDLNNILSGIVSYPELLLLDLPEDSRLRKPIMTIQQSGEKAAAIVQDLLTLARRGVPVTDILNLNRIIAEYLRTPEFGNLQYYHPNVRVITHLAPNLLHISGSGVHLAKTVMNLVSNAAEAIPDGGTVTLTTKNRYVDTPIRGYDTVTEGDYAILSVSDTGIGIDREDRNRIFEPFYTKKVMGRSGTGLGMAVVWGTLKDHAGYIDIRSEKGSGTTFTLYFPATRLDPAGQESDASWEAHRGRGESILVVDDVDVQREIASGMLEKLGYRVSTVGSGEAAVDFLKNHRVDLVMLDMIMAPGIDGLGTYKRILDLRPGQKAIIASGFSETHRVKEAQGLGAGGYLKKPYLLENLARAVRSELDG